MPDRALWRLDAASLRATYAAREVSPAEVVDAVANRIELLDDTIGAFTTLTLDRAQADAATLEKELAAGHSRGPLHGIPVGVKELFDVGGAVTTYGSPMLADRVAAQDAAAVARLREAGCIVIGLTRSHEFGWGITTQHKSFGSTRNPWVLDRVPGGSSGGSAAAVAAGMLPLALGSDTGGSIRIPATYCGVAGFKPTYGTVSKWGAVALAPSLDHPGPIARTVADLASATGALAGYDRRDPTTLRREFEVPDPAAGLEGLRVGVCPDLHLFPLSADHARVFDASVGAAEAGGGRLVEVAMPEAESILPAFAAIQMAEAYQYHHVDLDLFPARRDEYGSDVVGRLEMASNVLVGDYVAATRQRVVVRAAFERLFDNVDVLLTPMTAGGPSTVSHPDRGTHDGEPVPFRDLVMHYTIPQDLAGLPACAIPAGLDDDGVPVGVQVTARFLNDALALQAGAGLEAAIGLQEHWPAIAVAGP